MIKLLDSLDLKILQILDKDARTPFSDIAKLLDVSPSIIQIRFNALKKAGLVLTTTLLLNSKEFGIEYLGICVRAFETEVEEVVQFMKSLENEECKIIVWSTFGRFNIIALLISRNLIAPSRIRQRIKDHPFVREVYLSISKDRRTGIFESLNLEKEIRP
jgi:Lrp/AsnC family transcriptional regulator, regulator for asnA, asnC and gidA